MRTPLKFIVLVSGIVAIAAMSLLLIQRRAHAAYRENEILLEKQNVELAELLSRNQCLSNTTTTTTTTTRSAAPSKEDCTAELKQLQSQFALLQQQAEELSKQHARARRIAGAQIYSVGDSNLLDHSKELGSSVRGGPRAEGKQNDGRVLASALLRYADQHDGKFPLSFDEVASYFPKPLKADSPPWQDAPWSGTNDFEIVFQGSTNELINIPGRRIALIRERQPWPTPDGQFARVYGYADGSVSTVRSDDNFQSWDAQHLIPPPAR